MKKIFFTKIDIYLGESTPGNNFAENPRKFQGIFPRNPWKSPGIFHKKSGENVERNWSFSRKFPGKDSPLKNSWDYFLRIYQKQF